MLRIFMFRAVSLPRRGGFSGMVFVLLPVQRILDDVLPEPCQRLLIPDDLIEETVLPGEIATALGPDPARAGTFEVPDHGAQRTGTVTEAWRIDEQNSVKMIGHHDPGVEVKVGSSPCGLFPFLSHDLAVW